MIRIRVLLFAFLCTPLASLAGEYDGVWRPAAETPDMYYFVYHFGGTIVMTVLAQDNSGKYQGNWAGTFIGSISGGSANLNASAAGKTSNLSINFSSPTSGTIVINSCTSTQGDPCPPINTPTAFVRLL